MRFSLKLGAAVGAVLLLNGFASAALPGAATTSEPQFAQRLAPANVGRAAAPGGSCGVNWRGSATSAPGFRGRVSAAPSRGQATLTSFRGRGGNVGIQSGRGGIGARPQAFGRGAQQFSSFRDRNVGVGQRGRGVQQFSSFRGRSVGVRGNSGRGGFANWRGGNRGFRGQAVGGFRTQGRGALGFAQPQQQQRGFNLQPLQQQRAFGSPQPARNQPTYQRGSDFDRRLDALMRELEQLRRAIRR